MITALRRYKFDPLRDRIDGSGMTEEAFEEYAHNCVFKAYNERTNDLVVLKYFFDSKGENKNKSSKLKQEFDTARDLRDDHICLYRDYDFETDVLTGNRITREVIVMEYLNGGDIDDYLKSNNSSKELLNNFLKQILLGLHYLHKNGIWHLDIKPGNVIIHERPGDKKLIAKITDFGISRTHWDQSENRRGITYSYAAPERLQGKPENDGPACDVWSFGVMAWELITGNQFFERVSAAQLILADELKLTTHIKKKTEEVSGAFQKVLEACLKINPKERELNLKNLIKILDEVELPKTELEDIFDQLFQLEKAHPKLINLSLLQSRQADKLIARATEIEAKNPLINHFKKWLNPSKDFELLDEKLKKARGFEKSNPVLAKQLYQEVIELAPHHEDAIKGLERLKKLAPPKSWKKFFVAIALLMIGTIALYFGLTNTSKNDKEDPETYSAFEEEAAAPAEVKYFKISLSSDGYTDISINGKNCGHIGWAWGNPNPENDGYAGGITVDTFRVGEIYHLIATDECGYRILDEEIKGSYGGELISRDQMTITSCACPFVYLHQNNEWVFTGEIIKNQVGPQSYALDSLSIPNHFLVNDTLSLMIKEEKQEVSYIDQLYLKNTSRKFVPVFASAKENNLLVKDHHFRVLEFGDFFMLQFYVPNEQQKDLKLMGWGYYIKNKPANL